MPRRDSKGRYTRPRRAGKKAKRRSTSSRTKTIRVPKGTKVRIVRTTSRRKTSRRKSRRY
jgi:hypothetical protein